MPIQPNFSQNSLSQNHIIHILSRIDIDSRISSLSLIESNSPFTKSYHAQTFTNPPRQITLVTFADSVECDIHKLTSYTLSRTHIMYTFTNSHHAHFHELTFHESTSHTLSRTHIRHTVTNSHHTHFHESTSCKLSCTHITHTVTNSHHTHFHKLTSRTLSQTHITHTFTNSHHTHFHELTSPALA